MSPVTARPSLLILISIGDQAEIKFTLIGEPPFTFTYQRSELRPKKGGSSGKVLETHTVSGVTTTEYSIFSALEGQYLEAFLDSDTGSPSEQAFGRSLPLPTDIVGTRERSQIESWIKNRDRASRPFTICIHRQLRIMLIITSTSITFISKDQWQRNGHTSQSSYIKGLVPALISLISSSTNLDLRRGDVEPLRN